MKNLNLRTDFITIGDFQNEFDVMVMQISGGYSADKLYFFSIFYFSVCSFGGTNFILTHFSL